MTQLHEHAANPTVYDDLVDAPQIQKNEISPAVIKRELLHIMTTECYLNQAVHGSHATVRSDLEWFGPSLPHTSILTVFEFMGMSNTWLEFFKAFLAAPIRFPGETEARVRKRGTPISYSLSVICGEAIMFIMDFAVNRRADGLYLYRMHDDLWIWDADSKRVADGWDEINKCATLIGLKINKQKTGSAYVGSTNDAVARLPPGDIRWGFLRFDTERARFVIDQKDVDLHIKEMSRQLVNTKSIFGWVNAYNKYMDFFVRNFGGLPSNCVVKEHIIDIIDTLAHIQRELFPELAEGGAVGYLRKRIEDSFDTKDLPEGYFYFPISRGGLELRNTSLEFFALKRQGKPLAMPDDDMMDVDQIFHEDKAVGDQKFKKRIVYDFKVYASMREAWDLDTDTRRARKGYLYQDVEFMSFDEYTSLRESWLADWVQSYGDMLKSPRLHEVTLTPEMRELTRHWPGGQDGYILDWYGKWVVNMYGEDVVKKFGSLEVVDPNLIPIGMVRLFKSSRMKLDQ